jgi:hypothetical protein
MNFLEICQRADVTSGIQGMIQSVVDAVGAQEVIAGTVRDGFIDLQNERMLWEFMRRTVSFSTAVSTSTYSLTDIFGIAGAFVATDPHITFGRWQRKDPLLSYTIQDPDTGKWGDLLFVDFLDFEYHMRNRTTPGKPRYVTANEQDSSLIFQPIPDKIYPVKANYFVEPQVLVANAQTPILPTRFHNLLVYRSLDRIGNFYGNTGLYQRYALADAKMTGDLYRDQNPAVTAVIHAVA